MPYIFKSELDDSTKSEKLRILLARGNHKSAKDFPAEVGLLLEKNAMNGFAIPIPIGTVPAIAGAAV